MAFGPEPTRVRSALAAAAIWLGPVFVDVARLVTVRGRRRAHPRALAFLFRTDLGRTDARGRRQHLRRARDRRRRAARLRGGVRHRRGVRGRGRARSVADPAVPAVDRLSLSVASFNIVIIGGMGSLLGAFVGGCSSRVAESLGAVFLKPSLKELCQLLAPDRDPAVPPGRALRQAPP
jgi:hypothetical protein